MVVSVSAIDNGQMSHFWRTISKLCRVPVLSHKKTKKFVLIGSPGILGDVFVMNGLNQLKSLES